MTDTTNFENNDVIAPNLKFDAEQGTLAATTGTKGKTRTPEQMQAVAAKTPTSLHTHYAGWLQEKTGFEAPEGTDVAKIVQLAVSLYHDYQASPERAEQKALEAANKTPKAPSKVKQELAAKDAKIAELMAQLEAAKATPADKPAKATTRKTAQAAK